MSSVQHNILSPPGPPNKQQLFRMARDRPGMDQQQQSYDTWTKLLCTDSWLDCIGKQAWCTWMTTSRHYPKLEQLSQGFSRLHEANLKLNCPHNKCQRLLCTVNVTIYEDIQYSDVQWRIHDGHFCCLFGNENTFAPIRTRYFCYDVWW